jgi:hypothetical protein
VPSWTTYLSCFVSVRGRACLHCMMVRKRERELIRIYIKKVVNIILTRDRERGKES